jgi:pimeloyl-ACP methyl ester carboxylesterase
VLLALPWVAAMLPAAASASFTLDASFQLARAWMVLPLWAGAIALHVAAWRAGRWSRALRLLDAALHGLFAALLLWWSLAGPVVQAPETDTAVRGLLLVLAVVLMAQGAWSVLRDRPMTGRPPLAGVLGVLMLAIAARGEAQPPSPPASATPSASPAPSTYVRPAPPGELVDIGGRRLHVECSGPATGPTVIIEAGMSQFVAHGTYGEARQRIAAFARACIYDRAGLGWSDADPSPRTHDAMVDDLHRLIEAKRLPRPLVLVGHSMGGLLVRRYAQRHPRDVQAVVLLDATPEAYLFTPAAAAERAALVARISAGLANAKPGVPVVAMPASTPAATQLAFTPEVLAALREEYAAIDRTPEAMRGPGGYGTLGDVPLFVVRRGKTATPPSPSDAQWRSQQESLLALSRKSTMIVAEGAGHMFVYEQPAIAVAAVRQALGLPPTP